MISGGAPLNSGSPVAPLAEKWAVNLAAAFLIDAGEEPIGMISGGAPLNSGSPLAPRGEDVTEAAELDAVNATGMQSAPTIDNVNHTRLLIAWLQSSQTSCHAEHAAITRASRN